MQSLFEQRLQEWPFPGANQMSFYIVYCLNALIYTDCHSAHHLFSIPTAVNTWNDLLVKRYAGSGVSIANDFLENSFSAFCWLQQ